MSTSGQPATPHRNQSTAPTASSTRNTAPAAASTRRARVRSFQLALRTAGSSASDARAAPPAMPLVSPFSPGGHDASPSGGSPPGPPPRCRSFSICPFASPASPGGFVVCCAEFPEEQGGYQARPAARTGVRLAQAAVAHQLPALSNDRSKSMRGHAVRQFTEEEIKQKVRDGYILESPDEMSEGYRKSLIVQLLLQADTELMSAPAYWMAAQDAPSTNTQVSAVAIIQDELAHANIAYRLLEDMGLDKEQLIYGREPHEFKHPYGFDQDRKSTRLNSSHV